MDKFKQYLNQHVNELGNDEPGARVWENLQRELPIVREIKPASHWYKYAAAACLLALILFGVWHFKFNDEQKSTPPIIAKAKTTPAVNAVPDISRKEIAAIKPVNPVKNMIKRKAYHHPAIAENNDIAELKNVEANFTSVINLERRKINRTPLLAEDQSYFGYFKTRFRKIDSDEAALKNEIREQGFTNDMLLQLINIYQQKLNILKDLQTEINKTNNLVQQDIQPKEEKHRSYINI